MNCRMFRIRAGSSGAAMRLKNSDATQNSSRHYFAGYSPDSVFLRYESSKRRI